MRRATLRAWLELMRLSNAPTVVSNVLAGAAAGELAQPGRSGLPLGALLQVLLGALHCYWAGMILNDAFDARVDATERPFRPIPSGRVPVARARAVGLAMLAIGTALLAFAGMPADGSGGIVGSATFPWAVLLGACVLAYDVLHLQLPGASGLVAGCRALVIVIAALAVSPAAPWPVVAWIALPLLAYVLGVGIAARDEMVGLRGPARAVAWALPALACVAPAGVRWFAGIEPPAEAWMGHAALGCMGLAVVTAFLGTHAACSGRVPAAVGRWLGAIPAADAAACFALGRPGMAIACVAAWAAAALLRQRIAAS